jgi:GH15 family glucan-1,4-alpha-glucosidase
VTAPAHRPISDYAAIGNLRSAALIAPDGSIDWCCLPDFDSPSFFAALLDTRVGGRFRVRAVGAPEGRSQYMDHTNVLETIFSTGDGRLVLTDFMPLEGDIDGTVERAPAPEIHRFLHAEGGALEVEVEWAPRPDYARGEVRLEAVRDGFEAVAAGHRLMLEGLRHEEAEVVDRDGGPLLRARFGLGSGERRVLVTGLREEPTRREVSADASEHLLRETLATWREWVHKRGTRERSWARPYQELVTRSELCLKLLSYGPTGAIVAAPTTSLPEGIGGVRNWDYRYAWLRDAFMTVQAMHALGHKAEARTFIRWAERTAQQASHAPKMVQPVYTIRGETATPPEELDHLSGYRGSRPVQIGNQAFSQKQLDVYGDLLDGAYELAREGHELGPEIQRFLVELADEAGRKLHEPDDSVWEMERGDRHFTHSKLMMWVALDRAIQLAERFGLEGGDVEHWRTKREEARRLVLERGYSRERGAFTQTLDGEELDAALLLLPIHELLPIDDPRVVSTIQRIRDELAEHSLVYRYRADDGLPGEEGAFVLCSFWLVDALSLSGRLDEAHEVFDSLVRRASHVGLYSEQIDPRSGEFRGNFPQAFSHLGLINSALYLAHAEGRESPVEALVGTMEHRREAGRRQAVTSGVPSRG